MARPPYPGWLHYFVGSKTRALLIERLARHPEHQPYLREMARDTRAGIAALHGELRMLEQVGLVRSHMRGGARYYVLQLDHPLARPLCELVEACDGLDETWRADAVPSEFRMPQQEADRCVCLVRGGDHDA